MQIAMDVNLIQRHFNIIRRSLSSRPDDIVSTVIERPQLGYHPLEKSLQPQKRAWAFWYGCHCLFSPTTRYNVD